MQAAMQLVPFKDRAAKIEQFNADLKAGKLDISELYRKAVRHREHANLTNSIPQGLGMGGIAGVLLIVVASSPAGLALLAAGGIAGGRTYLGFRRWGRFQEAVRENDFTEYLTDQELSELEDLLTNSGKPATPVLAESYAQLIDSMDEVVELEGSSLLGLAKQFRGQETDTAAGDAVVDVKSEAVIDDDKDEAAISSSSSEVTSELQTLDLSELIYPPVVLLWGSQGSGKTTAANWIIYYAVEHDWLVCVADPHYAYGDWPGLPVYGKAGNYDECDLTLQAVLDESKRRYQERAEKGTKPHEFRQLLVVLEEFTDWSDRCKATPNFIRNAVKDFRKVGIHVLIISHGQTLTATGGAKGLRETFDNGTVKVQLFSEMKDVEIDNETKRLPRPTGECEFTSMGVDHGRFKVSDLSDWQVPTDANVTPFMIDDEKVSNNTTKAETKLPIISPILAPEKDDPFKVEDYQAIETSRHKRKVGHQDKIDGLDKTYEDAMAQISRWLRASPGTEFTTSDLVNKFHSSERKSMRKVIRAIVKRMGQSPQGCYIAEKDPQKGWIISYEDPEEEDDFVTIDA